MVVYNQEMIALLNMAIQIAIYGVFWKIGQNVDHLSQMKLITAFHKSYGQKKIMSNFMAISFVFWPDISECLKDP